jgi:accessory colonization factor AcfC
VATDHLETLGQLVDALKNSDYQLVNKIGNAISKQTGGTAPTNFDAAKDIVSKELVKAIVGAGGGVGEREELAKRMSSASTPKQLREQIEVYKTLMGAQRDALISQYENATGKKDAATRFNYKTNAPVQAGKAKFLGFE